MMTMTTVMMMMGDRQRTDRSDQRDKGARATPLLSDVPAGPLFARGIFRRPTETYLKLGEKRKEKKRHNAM